VKEGSPSTPGSKKESGIHIPHRHAFEKYLASKRLKTPSYYSSEQNVGFALFLFLTTLHNLLVFVSFRPLVVVQVLQRLPKIDSMSLCTGIMIEKSGLDIG